MEYYGDFKKAVLEKAGENETSRKLQGGGGKTEESFYDRCAPQIKGKWKFGKVHNIMPDALNLAFVEGMEHFDRKIPGFAAEGVILSGIESRTSSPVRIHRNEGGQSEIAGLYPCGEGAGYAGGIMSAAMDGIRMAEQIAKEYKAFEEYGQRGVF